jgi:hypothetical protein
MLSENCPIHEIYSIYVPHRTKMLFIPHFVVVVKRAKRDRIIHTIITNIRLPNLSLLLRKIINNLKTDYLAEQ